MLVNHLAKRSNIKSSFKVRSHNGCIFTRVMFSRKNKESKSFKFYTGTSRQTSTEVVDMSSFFGNEVIDMHSKKEKMETNKNNVMHTYKNAHAFYKSIFVHC